MKGLFGNPRHETDWSRLKGLAKFVMDAANGTCTVKLSGVEEVDEIRASVSQPQARSGQPLARAVIIGDMSFQPGDRILTPMASLHQRMAGVQVQRAAWKSFPLNAFGEKLRADGRRKKPADLRCLWVAHQNSIQDEIANTSHQ